MSCRFSRLAVCAALLCLPVEASSQELDVTPSSDRILSDPNFLPSAGEIYGTTSYTHGWIDGSSANSAGVDLSNFHISTNTLDQMLAYGITDDLSINASIADAPADYRDVDYLSGNSASFDSSGLDDPTFGATWRVIDQNPYPVDADLFGSYTPDLFAAHAAASDEEGTVARGGQSGTLGAALGYETRSFGLRGAFKANFLGNAETLDLADGDLVRNDAHTNYDLLLDSQTRLNEVFSVNAGIDRTFATSAGGVNLSNGASHFSEPGDTTALQLALNYQFVPNTFVISATYAHDFYDNDRTFYPNPAADTLTHNKSGNVAGVKLYYDTP